MTAVTFTVLAPVCIVAFNLGFLPTLFLLGVV